MSVVPCAIGHPTFTLHLFVFLRLGMRRHLDVLHQLLYPVKPPVPVFVSLRLFSLFFSRCFSKFLRRLMQSSFCNFGWFPFHV